jgi:transposase-like protein
MTEDRMALLELLRKGEEPAEEGGDDDFLRRSLRWLVQQLMEAEVSAQIGADRYERTDERTTQRNGSRTRPWDTRLGSLELQVPKLRTGSYFPTFLEPRRRAEQAFGGGGGGGVCPGGEHAQGRGSHPGAGYQRHQQE